MFRHLTPLLLAAATLLPATFASAQRTPPANPAPEMPLLSVTGTAEAAAAPDLATLRLGAVAQAEQAADAQSQVNQTVAKVTDALKQLGIPAADLSTAGLSLSPVYSQPNPRDAARGEPFTPRITAYRADITITARLTDLKKVGPAVDAAVSAGANEVQSLTFDLKDDTATRAQALTDAVKQARAKADALAKAAGVTLAYLHDLEESGTPPTPIPYAGFAARAMAASAAPTPVEPGQVHLTASVTLRYAITPAHPADGEK